MRIGLAEQTVLVALAHALALTRPATHAGSSTGDEPAPLKLPRGDALVEYLATAEATVKRVYCEMPNYEVSDRRCQKLTGSPRTRRAHTRISTWQGDRRRRAEARPRVAPRARAPYRGHPGQADACQADQGHLGGAALHLVAVIARRSEGV